MNTVVKELRKLKILGRKKVDAGKYNLVEPALVGPFRNIPDHIKKPSYYETGIPLPSPEEVEVKNSDEIDGMIKSCHLASTLLNNVAKYIKVGITADDVDNFVHQQCLENGAYPSPFNYKGFPKSICTSVNNVACHGIPDNRSLEDGDIINVDITVYLNGFHGDCSKTFLIGNVDDQGKELVSLTEECLMRGISVCGPGVPFRNIGYAIEAHASKNNYSVIPAFLGHGIGSYFHGPPDIYHTKNTYPGVMKPGMTFTIEPTLSAGKKDVEMLEDGWTIVTVDGSRTAQAEHTILIVENGCDILTNQH